METLISPSLLLKKKSERFDQIFNSSGIGIFIVNKNRIIIEANEACCKIFGYTYKELIGQSALLLHLSNNAYMDFATIAFNKVRQNKALNLEYPFRHKNGYKLWLRIAGDSIPTNEEVLWTITDITARIAAEERLKESESLLKNAEALAHFGSWEISLQNGKMKWSEGMYHIYGESPQEFTPSLENFYHFLSPEDIKKVEEVNQKAFLSHQSEQLEYEICRNDGSKVSLHTHRKAIYDKNELPTRLIGTSLDITKQKQNEQQIMYLNEALHLEVQLQLEKLRKQDKQLQYQSRLIQMGEMLSMIAHQWRQPLAAIIATTGFLSTKLLFETFDKKTFEEELDRIDHYVTHLSKTIDDFRNFFKATKCKENTTLEALIERTLVIVKPLLIMRNIQVTTNFNSFFIFQTYGNELSQAILNILKNAEDALLDSNIDEPKIWIKTFNDNTSLCIEISDNAGGIDENLFIKIFEPYFSTKLDKGGTGIGLYMSKTIIEEHCKGILSVNNNKEGAVFTITLPK